MVFILNYKIVRKQYLYSDFCFLSLYSRTWSLAHEDGSESVSEEFAGAAVNCQVYRAWKASEAVDDENEGFCDGVVQKGFFFCRKCMKHRDNHDGNFYNEENGDNEDEHSCDV